MQLPTFRPRAVVADDDPDIRDLVAFKLTQAGFDVTCVGDGLRGLGRLRRLARRTSSCST